MKFRAEIDIMPLKELLDPQGKAVTSSLKNIGIPEIVDVRIGKHIAVDIEATNEKTAGTKIDKACQELLANPIMENFSYKLIKL